MTERRRELRDARHGLRSLILGTLLLPLLVIACGEHNPRTNTPTSGRMVLFVEAPYAPLFTRFAEQFGTRVGSATIEVRPVSARAGVEALINGYLADTAHPDTAVSYGLIIARRLLDDEQKLLVDRGIDNLLKETLIAYDALALGVANDSPIEEATVEGLRSALALADPNGNDLIAGGPTTSVRFHFPSPNSSSYAYVRDSLLSDSASPRAPAIWHDDPAAMLAAVTAGQGIAIDGWYTLSDSTDGIKTLRIGGGSSEGDGRPVRAHTTSLVMKLYPMKLPIVGYTLGATSSLGYGFLRWVGLSEGPQRELATIGLEPENVRFEFTR